jgi:hypothetical protein
MCPNFQVQIWRKFICSYLHFRSTIKDLKKYTSVVDPRNDVILYYVTKSTWTGMTDAPYFWVTSHLFNLKSPVQLQISYRESLFLYVLLSYDILDIGVLSSVLVW